MRVRYTGDLGCRYRGVPHDLRIIHQNDHVKVERCAICNKSYRFHKGFRGRTDNVKYLKAHVRNFAQKFGATKAVYHRVYKPELSIIRI